MRNIDHITNYFVSNLVLATKIQRPTSVRWQAIEIREKRNLILSRNYLIFGIDEVHLYFIVANTEIFRFEYNWRY